MKRLLLLLPLLGAACVSHDLHRVTDLDSGKVYYTKEMRKGLTSGNLYLIDAKTGAKVTVHSSTVEEITEEEFRLETGRK